MTTGSLGEQMKLELLAGVGGLGREVRGCHIGDLLSWVMSRLGEGGAWITVIGNVNAVAVAKLTDAACVILCESAHLDEDARQQADANEIPVFSSPRSAYDLALAFSRLHRNEV